MRCTCSPMILCSSNLHRDTSFICVFQVITQAMMAELPVLAAILSRLFETSKYDIISYCLVVCFSSSCLVLPCPFLACRVVSCRVVSCRVMRCGVLSCNAVSCLVLSCGVMSCNAVRCCVMQCRVVRVMQCGAMRCGAVSCRVIGKFAWPVGLGAREFFNTCFYLASGTWTMSLYITWWTRCVDFRQRPWSRHRATRCMQPLS